MRDPLQLGLVCAGQVSRSVVGRLPGLRQHIRWVKSTTISAASRAANALGNGTAVRGWDGLSEARAILIQAPDGALPHILREMGASDLLWRGRIVVLVDSHRDSTALTTLSVRGASTGSLNWVGTAPDRYLIEGTDAALKFLRLLLPKQEAEIVQVRTGGKGDYFSAVREAAAAVGPLVAATAEGLMRAGIEKAAAEKTAAYLMESSLRAYLRSGKRMLKRRRGD
jgi:hypothetical protein